MARKNKGGSPFKERGREPLRKTRQRKLRDLALEGVGFGADGKPTNSVGDSKMARGGIGPGEPSSASLFFGYKLQRAKRRSK